MVPTSDKARFYACGHRVLLTWRSESWDPTKRPARRRTCTRSLSREPSSLHCVRWLCSLCFAHDRWRRFEVVLDQLLAPSYAIFFKALNLILLLKSCIKTLQYMRGSSGLVVVGNDSCLRGHGSESQCDILDGSFFTTLCCKFALFFVWKYRK